MNFNRLTIFLITFFLLFVFGNCYDKKIPTYTGPYLKISAKAYLNDTSHEVSPQTFKYMYGRYIMPIVANVGDTLYFYIQVSSSKTLIKHINTYYFFPHEQEYVWLNDIKLDSLCEKYIFWDTLILDSTLKNREITYEIIAESFDNFKAQYYAGISTN